MYHKLMCISQAYVSLAAVAKVVAHNRDRKKQTRRMEWRDLSPTVKPPGARCIAPVYTQEAFKTQNKEV